MKNPQKAAATLTSTPHKKILFAPQSSSGTFWLTTILSATMVASAWSATILWKGPGGTGDSGQWNAGTNWNGGLPTSGDAVYFDYNIGGPYTSQTATVTIASGVTAQASNIMVRLGKILTLHLEDTASLSAWNLQAGAGTNTASSVLVTGPTTGSATANFTRIYMGDVDTGLRQTTTLSGSNLTVNLTNNYTSINSKASLILTNNVTVDSSTTTAGSFYVRTGVSGGVYSNRMQVMSGSVKGYLIDNSGLFQLSQNGSLAPSSVSGGTMNVYVRTNSRFEAEGSGIHSNVVTRVFTNGIFAIGLTDPETGDRAAAATLNLSSKIQLDAGSMLEMHLFGTNTGETDQIALGATGVLTNVSSGGILKLVVDESYTLQWGDKWTLFTGETTNIKGNFNTSLIDTNVWDISDLNEAGGWQVSAIPEPGALALLLAGVSSLLILRRKRRLC